MLLFLLAAQAATVPATSQPPAAKAKQICEMREITGSRSKRRVCRDSSGRLDLGPGVSDQISGRVHQVGAGAPSAPSQ